MGRSVVRSIQPGETFEYELTVRQNGTFMYQCDRHAHEADECAREASAPRSF